MIFGKKKEIYFDNAATTPVDDKVVKAMMPYYTEKYGNASSQHLLGQEAKRDMEEARRVIAKSINAKHNEIIFTGSGTEANNFVLKGLYFWNKSAGTGKNHIITTKIEHDCVLNSCRWLETQGAKVTYLDVDEDGFIDLNKLKKEISDETLIVSVIHGNNEIGTIQNIEEIGKICQEKGVYFHTDACQSYTKVPLNVKRQNLDFMTLNAHKIHGPKGVGVLFIRGELRREIDPLLHGGGHEYGLRSSTENIAGIVGFATAVKIARESYVKDMQELRDYLIDEILKIPKTRLNGSRDKNRLCNNVNISFMNVEGEALGGYLNAYGISTSTGSACSSHSLEPSHVLKALGLDHAAMNSSIRISISKFNTKEEADYFLKILPGIVEKLRKMSPVKL